MEKVAIHSNEGQEQRGMSIYLPHTFSLSITYCSWQVSYLPLLVINLVCHSRLQALICNWVAFPETTARIVRQGDGQQGLNHKSLWKDNNYGIKQDCKVEDFYSSEWIIIIIKKWLQIQLFVSIKCFRC